VPAKSRLDYRRKTSGGSGSHDSTKMKPICFAAIVFCALAFGCEREGMLPVEYEAEVWVAIEPTQCMSNAWERDWLAQNGNAYEDYPKDLSQPGLEPEEYEIIREYYLRQGVVVLGSATTPGAPVVCLACSCREGRTLYLLVRDRDVETMVGFGYRLEDPPPAVQQAT
jgi:hypothetical protein